MASYCSNLGEYRAAGILEENDLNLLLMGHAWKMWGQGAQNTILSFFEMRRLVLEYFLATEIPSSVQVPPQTGTFLKAPAAPRPGLSFALGASS